MWTISSFSQSTHLYISLEEALAVHPDSVFRLDLSGNRLETVPKEILRFKNLRELDLSKNKLVDLPDEMNFPALEILNLTRNKFEVFPEEICKQVRLKQLFFGRNEITVLPDCIGDLKELLILDLWLNFLTDLPSSLMKLEQLKILDVRGMNFSDEFQGAWTNRLSWVKIEFDKSCDCAN